MNKVLALVAMTCVVVALAWFAYRWYEESPDGLTTGSNSSVTDGDPDSGEASRRRDTGPKSTVTSKARDSQALDATDDDRREARPARPAAAAFGLKLRAVDANGAPLAGVEAQAYELGAAPRGPKVAEVFRGRSQRDGRIVLKGLPPRRALRLRLRGMEYRDRRVTVTPGAPGETRDLGDLSLELGLALRGRTIDSEGDPIADVRLRAWPTGDGGAETREGLARPDPREVRSDATGRFVLAGLGPGDWRLRAEAAGWRPLRRGGIRLNEGREPDDLDLVLERGGSLQGRVVDAQGNPIAGAALTLAPAWVDPSASDGLLDGSRRTRSDESGRFAFPGLATEAVNLQVRCRGFIGEDLIDYRLAAEPLTVQMKRAGRVWGRVVSAGREEVLAADVAVAGMAGRGRALPVVRDAEAARRLGRDVEGSEGLYLVEGLESARVTLLVSAEGHATHREANLAVAPDSQQRLDLELIPEARVAGRVLRPSGEPVVGAAVIASRPREEENEGPGIRILGARILSEAVTDDDGAYVLRGLSAGSVNVQASFGGGESSEEVAVALTAGEEARCDLRLEPSGRLEGVVRDAAGAVAPGELVRVIPQAGRANGRVEIVGEQGRERMGISDEEGRFVVEGLLPGEYRAVCGAGSERAALEMFAPGRPLPGTACSIRADETTELDLVLPETSSVRGRVLEAGRPVAGARLRLVKDDQNMGFGGRDGFTDEWGEFRFDSVEPGDWILEASPPRGLVPLKHAFVLAEGRDEVVDLKLPTGIISGRVTRDGEPLAEVDVVVRKWIDGAPEPQQAGIMISITSGDGGDSAETRQIGESLNRVRTDERGHYRLRSLPEGDWQVGIEGQGLIRDKRAPVSVKEGHETRGIDFAARGGASARLTLTERPEERSFYLVGLTRLGEGTKDARNRSGDGRPLRFEGLAPGSYRVKVQRISLSTGQLREAGETTFEIDAEETKEVEHRIDESSG